MKTSSAYVFDIKRFAVHDGTGIRTTVFFKGCPLRCVWCQNPEGLLKDPRPIYLASNCIHCRLCERNSYEGQMVYKDDRPYFNYDYQKGFDNLVEICPSTAIQYDAKAYTVDELMEKIEDDKIFFRESGGVTFSGGEPLLQGAFLLEMLKRCKEKDIHTAIETSFFGSWELIESLLPYLDLIYVDLKIFDESSHIEATGVSNQRILDNIRRLLTSEHKDKVIIRTPLIPGFTANQDNIQAICQFILNCNQDVHYELLNYNPLASAKYDLTEFTYGIDDHYKMYTQSQMQSFYDLAIQSGIKNLIIE